MKPFYFQNDDGGIEVKETAKSKPRLVYEEELAAKGFFENKLRVKNFNRMLFKKFYGCEPPKFVKKTQPIVEEQQ